MNVRDLNQFDEGTEVTPELLVEKKLVKKALESTNWNRKKASKLLDISYKSMLLETLSDKTQDLIIIFNNKNVLICHGLKFSF